jgi:nitrogen-specific signal transduction histidine kinase
VNSRSKSLLDFIQAPVLVGDPDGRVIYVNPAFETDFLVPVEEVSGLPVANLFDGGGREAVLHAVARVCGNQAQCDSASFSLFVGDRGYKALASSVEADGGRVGVILLLLREGASEARVKSFQREILTPLDELSACLSDLAEFAEQPDPRAQRLALADGVRAVERIRKWASGVAESLKAAPQD